MAKLERTLSQDFDRLLHQIEQKLLQGSFTATLEDSSDFYGEGARCSVRVFERYSYFGGNRLRLNLCQSKPRNQLFLRFLRTFAFANQRDHFIQMIDRNH